MKLPLLPERPKSTGWLRAQHPCIVPFTTRRMCGCTLRTHVLRCSMHNEAEAVRAASRRIGLAKAASEAADLGAHLALTPGQRIEAAVRLSEELIAAFPASLRDGLLEGEGYAVAAAQRARCGR